MSFKHLSDDEQFNIYNRAWTYFHDHADEVANKQKYVLKTTIIEPLNLDTPEFWSGLNWNWYLFECLPYFRVVTYNGIGDLK